MIRYFATLMFLALSLLGLSTSVAAAPLGTSFTYQGQLRDNAQPANGLYDFQFRLLDQAAGGSVIAGPTVLQDIPVENGIFSADIDFGATFNGDARWLEISVRNGASAGTFDLLSPRQTLNAAPYAMYALSGNPGPQGPSGIVQVSNFSGVISPIQAGGGAAPWVFAGPTTTVSVNSAQRLLGAGTASVNKTGIPYSLSYGLCQRIAGSGGALTNFNVSNYPDIINNPGQSISLSASASTAPLAASATYEVGFCVKNKQPIGGPDLNSDFVTGWVMVVN